MIRESDYENYDYREFWQDDKRLYEDNSERIALRKLFKGVETRDRTFVDLGCGYGRLFNEYSSFRNIILVDYSLKNLKNAKLSISKFLGKDKKKLESIYFIAADVNNLPFRDELIDVAMTVRLIHHISEPGELFLEVRRILKKDSLFLLEFANKRNLKNIIRFLTGRLKGSPFSRKAFSVGETILNHHPGYISSLLDKHGFRIIRRISVSNFRLGFLKKNIRLKTLLSLENLYQDAFSWAGTGPSIFFKTEYRSTKGSVSIRPDTGVLNPEDMFICPSCKSKGMDCSDKGRVSCSACSRQFNVIEGIYDFKS